MSTVWIYEKDDMLMAFDAENDARVTATRSRPSPRCSRAVNPPLLRDQLDIQTPV
jgi:hypothetical protein